MTYKEMYDDAYRKLQTNAHRISDTEFAAAVSAKAKQNSVITGNGSNIREIPADRSEYKSHRIRNAVVGIALTAAVLTGAVFGLNWLNEHGGLHEGGIETDTSAGAGYHDPAVSEYPAYTMIPTILPEETVFRFNGLIVKPTDYIYDGLTWQISYEMTYTDGIPDNFENDVKISVSDGNTIHSAEKLSVISTQENTAILIWSQTGTEVMQSREARFMVTREELVPTDTDALEALADCSIKVEIPNDSHVYTLEPHYLTYIFDENDIQQIKKVNICKFTAEIVADAPEPLPDNFITDMKIVMKDGTELHPTVTKEILNTFSMDDKMEHYFVYSLPGIDTDDIDGVYINNLLITNEETPEIPDRNTAESSESNITLADGTTDIIGQSFEFSDSTVTFTSCERYGNTVKLTMDIAIKEGFDRTNSVFGIERDGYIPSMFCTSDYEDDRYTETLVFAPDIPVGETEELTLVKVSPENDNNESVSLKMTGAGYAEAYTSDLNVKGSCHDVTGNEREVILKKIIIDPISISFDATGYPDADISFSIRFRDGRIYRCLAPWSSLLDTESMETVSRVGLGRGWADENGNNYNVYDVWRSDKSGNYYCTKGENGYFKYVLLLPDDFKLSIDDIESVEIFGAEILIRSGIDN